MVSQTATSLSEALRESVNVIIDGVAGVDDAAARRRPGEGEWSIAEQVSHLCGADAQAFLSTVTRFVTEDVPEIDVTPGISHFESRAEAPLADLLGSFRSQYDEIASFLAGLNEAQLKRTAHIPLLKETPFGDHPTLEQWVTVIRQFHLSGHTAQIAETRKAIGAA